MFLYKQRVFNYLIGLTLLTIFVLNAPIHQSLKYVVFIIFNFLFIISKYKKINFFDKKIIVYSTFYFLLIFIIKLLPINFNFEINNFNNFNTELLEPEVNKFYQDNYGDCIEKIECYGQNEYKIKFKNKYKGQFLNIQNINELRTNIFTSPGTTLIYNNPYLDKHNYPYILKIEFPNLYYGSNFCYDDFKNKSNCHNISETLNSFTIIGVGEENNLILKQNLVLNLIKFLSSILLFFFLILLLRSFYEFRFRNKFELLYPFSLIFWLIIFSYTNYDNINFLNSYFFQYPGGDGYWYLFLGNLISENFKQFNFIETVRGGVDIFYFMPGMRYFVALEKLIFGNAYYLHLVIFCLLPFILKKLLELYLPKRITYLLIFSFCFFPLMHHMGFSYYQYVRYSSKVFAEPVAYTIFLYGFVRLVYFYRDRSLYFGTLPFTCLLLCISCIMRPNLSSSSFFLLLFPLFYLITTNRLKSLFFFILSGFVIFLPFIHNFLFGNELVLFTSAVFTDANIKITLKDYLDLVLNFEIQDRKKDMIFEIIKNFFHPIEIHKYFIILGLLFSLRFKYFINHTIIPLHILIFSQFFLFPFLNPGPRYIWVFWLSSLIISLYVALDIRKSLKFNK